MADNVQYASDEIASVHYPRAKITIGPDGTATGDLAGRLISAAVGGAVYTDQRQKVVRLSVTPTVSTAPAYTSGDAVGGLLTFSNAARDTGAPFVVKNVVVIDKADQKPALNLVLFDRTFTASADNAVFDPSDADLANCVGMIEVATTDYADLNTNAFASWPQTTANEGLYVVPNGSDLFGQLYTTSTPTFASTADLIIIATIVQF